MRSRALDGSGKASNPAAATAGRVDADTIEQLLPLILGNESVVRRAVEDEGANLVPRLVDLFARYAAISHPDRMRLIETVGRSPAGKKLFAAHKPVRRQGAPPWEGHNEYAFEKAFRRLVVRAAHSAAELSSVSMRTEAIRRLLLDSLRYPAAAATRDMTFRGSDSAAVSLLDHTLHALLALDVQPAYRGGNTQVDGNPKSYGLDPCSYLTAFSDYARVFAALRLSRGQKVAELGSAFGRAAIVLRLLHPEAEYIGYEVVPERHKESVRMTRSMKLDVTLERADVLSPGFRLAPADYYYMYNPLEFDPAPPLEAQLREVARQRRVVLMSVPPRSQTAEERKWLKRIPAPRGMQTLREVGFYEVLPLPRSRSALHAIRS
jgi:hypothetical protein